MLPGHILHRVSIRVHNPYVIIAVFVVVTVHNTYCFALLASTHFMGIYLATHLFHCANGWKAEKNTKMCHKNCVFQITCNLQKKSAMRHQ